MARQFAALLMCAAERFVQPWAHKKAKNEIAGLLRASLSDSRGWRRRGFYCLRIPTVERGKQSKLLTRVLLSTIATVES